MSREVVKSRSLPTLNVCVAFTFQIMRDFWLMWGILGNSNFGAESIVGLCELLQKPKWQPGSIEDIDTGDVKAVFAPFETPADELVIPDTVVL